MVTLQPQPISDYEKERGLRVHYRRSDLGPEPPAPRCCVCDLLLVFTAGHFKLERSKYCNQHRPLSPSKSGKHKGRDITFGIILLLLSVIITQPLFAQGGNIGSNSSPTQNRAGVPLPGVNITVCAPLTTTAAIVTSNLAILTMSSNPITAGFKAGTTIQVTGFTGGDTYLNAGTITNGQIVGGWNVLSVSTSTITFQITHANATASSVGSVLQEGNAQVGCAALSSVYQDPALAVPVTQPFKSDQLGNWNVFAAPSIYYAQFYAPGVTTTLKQYSVGCVPLSGISTCAGSGSGSPHVPAGAIQTYSGSSAFGAENVISADGGAFAKTAAGINAAYASCSGSPCEVNVTYPGTYTDTVINIPSGDTLWFAPGTFIHAGITCAASGTVTNGGCSILGTGEGSTVLQVGNSVNIDGISSASYSRFSTKEISAASRTSNTITATCTATCGFSPGDIVQVEFLSPSNFNGMVTVATSSGTQFTYPSTGSNGPATGYGLASTDYGTYQFVVKDLSIDGNYGNNTSGNCMSIASPNPILINVEVRNCPGVGIETSFGESPNNFFGNSQVFPTTNNVTVHNANLDGILDKGPHDFTLQNTIVDYSAQTGGLACMEFWRSFRLDSSNTFLCANHYGILMTRGGAGQISNSQTESVGVKPVTGWPSAPSPNLTSNTIIFANTIQPALEIDGYDNTWQGWIGNTLNTQPLLYINGGAGNFNFDVLFSIQNAPWVNFSALNRSTSQIHMWGINTCPVVGCLTGNTSRTDDVWLMAGNVIVENQTSPFTASEQFNQGITAPVGYSAIAPLTMSTLTATNNSGADDAAAVITALKILSAGGNRTGIGLTIGDGTTPTTSNFEIAEDIANCHAICIQIISTDPALLAAISYVPAGDDTNDFIKAVNHASSSITFQVDNEGHVLSGPLAGSGERPLCATALGVLDAASCPGTGVTVNGGSPLPSPANIQNGPTVNGLTVVQTNPSLGNVQASVTGRATAAAIPTDVVYNDSANTYTTGLQDFSAVTLKVPAAAAFVASAVSTFGLDTSTTKNPHVWVNGADAIIPVVSGSWVNGNCGSIVFSGGQYAISDNGSPCGSGSTTAWSTITAGTNSHAGSFVMSGNTLDLSAAAAALVPLSAAYAPTADASIGVNSTNHHWVFGTNGTTITLPLTKTVVATQLLSSYDQTTGAFGQRALVSADIPNNAANTTGQANTALALASSPSLCSATAATYFSTGIAASGTAQGCNPGAIIIVANAGSTGTTTSTLTKLTGAPSTAVKAATTDTIGIVGITISGAGTSSNATIQTSGQVNCVFDGATTAGHYVGISTGTAGDCHDTGIAGSTLPPSGQIIGYVLSTNGGAGTYQIDETVGSSSGCNPMTTLGDVIYGGALGVCTRLAGPTGPDGVPWSLVEASSSSLATALAFAEPGIVTRAVTGSTSTDTISSTDCSPKRVSYQGSVNVATALPTPTTLSVPNCVFRAANNSTSTVTFTSAGGLTINGSGTLALLAGQVASFYVDPSGSWDADVTEQAVSAGTNVTLTRSAYGVTVNASGGGGGSVLQGQSSSLGGGALIAGACSTTTITIGGVATGMVPSVSPETNPGAGYYWKAYISGANTVTVGVCAATAGTPTASLYDVTVVGSATGSAATYTYIGGAVAACANPSCSVSYTPTAGNLVAVGFDNVNTSATVTCSDDGTSTWATAILDTTSFSGHSWGVCYAIASSGVTTIQFTGSGGNFQSQITVAEYNPSVSRTTASVLDQTSVVATATSGSITAGSVTTSQSSGLIFGVVKVNAAPPITGTGIYTMRQEDGSFDTLAILDGAFSMSGTYAVTGTLSSNQWWAYSLTFK